jgi:hypothetical protein
MKTKSKKFLVKFSIYISTLLLLIIIPNGLLGQKNLTFTNCSNYKDSCIFIGDTFIKKLANKDFDNLPTLFSDNIFFRALIPASLRTSNKSTETAKTFKDWFYVDDSEQYKLLDSKVDFFVDCLHIYYRLFETYKGDSYNVEQHLYCEISSGKIQKLSLVCSGFRKLDKN